eukprot:PhM_4_TR12906/c1_g1_i1/m.105951
MSYVACAFVQDRVAVANLCLATAPTALHPTQAVLLSHEAGACVAHLCSDSHHVLPKGVAFVGGGGFICAYALVGDVLVGAIVNCASPVEHAFSVVHVVVKMITLRIARTGEVTLDAVCRELSRLHLLLEELVNCGTCGNPNLMGLADGLFQSRLTESSAASGAILNSAQNNLAWLRQEAQADAKNQDTHRIRTFVTDVDVVNTAAVKPMLRELVPAPMPNFPAACDEFSVPASRSISPLPSHLPITPMNARLVSALRAPFAITPETSSSFALPPTRSLRTELEVSSRSSSPEPVPPPPPPPPLGHSPAPMQQQTATPKPVGMGRAGAGFDLDDLFSSAATPMSTSQSKGPSISFSPEPMASFVATSSAAAAVIPSVNPTVTLPLAVQVHEKLHMSDATSAGCVVSGDILFRAKTKFMAQSSERTTTVSVDIRIVFPGTSENCAVQVNPMCSGAVNGSASASLEGMTREQRVPLKFHVLNADAMGSVEKGATTATAVRFRADIPGGPPKNIVRWQWVQSGGRTHLKWVPHRDVQPQAVRLHLDVEGGCSLADADPPFEGSLPASLKPTWLLSPPYTATSSSPSLRAGDETSVRRVLFGLEARTKSTRSGLAVCFPDSTTVMGGVVYKCTVTELALH